MRLICLFFVTFWKNPKEAFRKTIRKVLPYYVLEHKETSYQEHNRQYETSSDLEWHKKRYQEYANHNLFNAPENRVRDLIQKNPGVRAVAVDIGCGAGWTSAELSQYFRRIVAIEPSTAALRTAQQLFPSDRFSNIEWKNGFAQDVLSQVSLTEPALFVTMAVLSHLAEADVIEICSTLNRISPRGSLLSFGECWGREYHEFMWHVHTQKWWCEQLAGWELDFHGPSIQNTPMRHMGIHGIKIA